MVGTRANARQSGVSRSTIKRRMAAFGISADAAAAIEHNKPAWMVRIELAEGQTVEQILRDAARAAAASGYYLIDHAEEWGVPYNTLWHWSRKWGITWPPVSKRKH